MGCCSPSQNTSSSSTKLPAWVNEAGKANYDFATEIAGKDFVPYTGDRVADLTGRQTTAMGLLDGVMPSTLTTGKTGIDMSQLGKYMNPFTKDVIDTTRADMVRGAEMQGETLDNTFHAGGAFGDARQGAYDAEIGKNLASEVGKMSAGLNSQNFAQALAALQAEPGIENQQMGGAYDYIRNLLGLGAVEQGQGQAEEDFAYQQFQQEQGKDKDSLQILLSALGMTPYDKTSTQTTPGASPLAQGLGMGMNVASMFL